MFATVEEKLIVGLLASIAVLVGLFGFVHHERVQGAAVCVRQDESAQLKQSRKDASAASVAVAELHAQLAALVGAAPAAAPMRLCNVASSRVSPRSATSSAQSQPAAGSRISDSGMQAGTESGPDIGAAVQDLTLECVLGVTNAQDLWKLAVKESTP